MYDLDKAHGVGRIGHISAVRLSAAQPLKRITIAVAAALSFYLVAAGTAGADPSWQGGPIMQTVQAHLIFWRAPGHDTFATPPTSTARLKGLSNVFSTISTGPITSKSQRNIRHPVEIPCAVHRA
jgi:hypothetical protein